MKGIAVLGSTGSIGVSTLDVVMRHPDRFRVVALTANRNVDRMAEQCRLTRPSYAVMADAPAAAALREDGDRAFYYHGPHRSMVTVGLFTFDDDFIQEGKQRAYGPGIEELREKYPYNLVNGITVIQRNKDGETIGEQQSLIVRVP